MSAPEAATRTTCPYCGVGCGVLASVNAERVEIAGDPAHPANFGRLCSKGSALGETMSLDGRLLHPRIGGRRASWDEALDRVAGAFASAIAAHGPGSVAFYVSGQLLIEDYYVANKLMKGFIGSGNIDSNSRLCMSSSVAGHRRAFGADTVPGVYADLEEADLVVLVGANLAWCHPVLHQRLIAARETRGAKLVVIDPRATATSEQADLHLALAPGADVALFNGLLAHLSRCGAVHEDYVARHTVGLAGALAEARRLPVEAIARITRLSAAALQDFFALFSSTERVVTLFSQGVNQSTAGTDKVNAIINCHLATGRIGRPGMGPFSITGQPNAMGGREVGGLANLLAAHMDFGNDEHLRLVRDFWGAPSLATSPGLKAVDLFRAVGQGQIKALWIMGANPVVSMPEADRVREALSLCPFVVVSDVVERNDTTAFADVLLPSLAWGEKSGTVTNSERRMSRQRAFLPAPGEARADWRQMTDVAQRMGFREAFAYESPAAIFREYSQMTTLGDYRRRDLDLGGVATLSDADYASLEPFQWPRRRGEPEKETRFFADGGFFHPDGKARFISTPYRAPATAPRPERPFTLNTGRIRDQWHTMTRTGKAWRLMAQTAEPFVEICPKDAARLGLTPADLAEVESDQARAVLRVVVTDRVRQGEIFAPMHWNGQFSSAARVDALTGSAVDPVSGQPELKFTTVSLRRFDAGWFGFLAGVRTIDCDGLDYFARAPAKRGQRAEVAARSPLDDGEGFARRRLGLPDDAEIVAYRDAKSGEFRLAAFEEGRLTGLFFAARTSVALARDALMARLGEQIAPPERLGLLAGRLGAGQKDKGLIVCACFEVGRSEILAAAAAGARTMAAVGAATKAGTNCGSCRAEVGRVVREWAAIETDLEVPAAGARGAIG